MSKTVFCTFEQQDLADIAMGRLRSDVAGIQSVQYAQEHRARRRGAGVYNPAEAGEAVASVGGYLPLEAFAPAAGPAPMGYGGFFPLTADVPKPAAPRPVLVKIVCDESAHKKVVAKLVNLHAQKIVTVS